MESLMSLRLSGSGPRSRAAINLQVPSYFFKISYYYFDFFFWPKDSNVGTGKWHAIVYV